MNITEVSEAAITVRGTFFPPGMNKSDVFLSQLGLCNVISSPLIACFLPSKFDSSSNNGPSRPSHVCSIFDNHQLAKI